MTRAGAGASGGSPSTAADAEPAQPKAAAEPEPQPKVEPQPEQGVSGSQSPAEPAPGAATGDGGVRGPVPAAHGSGGGWDLVLRIAGVVIAVVAAFASGTFELLLTTMRAGDLATVWRGDAIGSGHGPLLGVSVLLAIVGNYGIAWFAVSTTRRRWALGPPWALWTLLMLIAAGVRTPEGDYLLGGENWIALVMILVGSLTFAAYAYRMILKGPAARPPDRRG
jgi:hypothetical protein